MTKFFQYVVLSFILTLGIFYAPTVYAQNCTIHTKCSCVTAPPPSSPSCSNCTVVGDNGTSYTRMICGSALNEEAIGCHRARCDCRGDSQQTCDSSEPKPTYAGRPKLDACDQFAGAESVIELSQQSSIEAAINCRRAMDQR